MPEVRASVRRCSLISAGPVAQFSPIMSTPSGASAVSAAPISEPSSMVPVVSTVTWAKIGSATPASASARLAPDDGGLRLEQVLRRLDEDRVRAAGDQPGHLLLVGVAQDGVGGVAQARQLRAGTDGAQHPARVGGRRPVVGDPAGDGRAGLGELVDALGDRVLPEVGQVRAEGVGLDAVDADGEVGVVHAGDQLGPGHVEDLVAALVPLEVVQRRVGGLEHGAHRPVRHDDALGEGLAKRAATVGGMRGCARCHDREAYRSDCRTAERALRWRHAGTPADGARRRAGRAWRSSSRPTSMAPSMAPRESRCSCCTA